MISDEPIYLKSYILCTLDNETIQLNEKSIPLVIEDTILMVLLSHNYPLIPFTVLFDVKLHESKFFECIKELILNQEILIISKYPSIDDFLHEDREIFSPLSNYSPLFNEVFKSQLLEMSPHIIIDNDSMTHYLDFKMKETNFESIRRDLIKSKMYNKKNLIKKTTDKLSSILDKRKHKAIIAETFSPILDYSKINEKMRNYTYRKVINYNNSLYYKKYSSNHNAIIPSGLKSSQLMKCNLEEMNDSLEYTKPSNNFNYWRKIFEALEIDISSLDCQTTIRLLRNHHWSKIVVEVKKILEDKIPFTSVFSTPVKIYNYLLFPPSNKNYSFLSTDLIIEKFIQFIELNLIKKDTSTTHNIVNVTGGISGNLSIDGIKLNKEETMANINIGGNVNGDILTDNASKNITNIQINDKIDNLIDSLKQEDINNSDDIIINIDNLRNEPSKLKEYLSTLGNIGSIGSAVAGLIAIL